MVRFFSPFFYLLMSFASYAQMELTICESGRSQNVGITYHDDTTGRQINDSCRRYTFHIDEPEYLFLHTQSQPASHYRIWVDPRHQQRTILVNNSAHTIRAADTLSIERDEELCNTIYTALELAPSIEKHDSLKRQWLNCLENYIVSHPDSFLALYDLRMVVGTMDIQKAIRYRDLIKKANNGYPIYKEVEKHIASHKYKSIPQIGDTLIAFEAEAPGGKVFKSQTAKGSTILLYFWFAGCSACRKMSDPFKLMYERYKSKGFEIVSVSIDDEAEWEKASLSLHYPWINIRDLEGQYGLLPNHYNVDAYPSFILFDKERKIKLITDGDELALIEGRVKELLKIK